MLNNIINTINTVCNTKLDPYIVEPQEVFQAALHCFYFMKPSNKRDKFVSDLEFLFMDTLEEAKALKAVSKMSMRDCMLHVATKHLLIQLTENFDEEYFQSQVKRLNLNTEYGKEFISNHIRTFTKEQLLHYFELVGSQNFNGGRFISDEAFINMWNELDDECGKVSEYFGSMKSAIIENPDRDEDEEPIITFDKPYINDVTGEVSESLNPLYFFDYLPSETITRIFEAHVDGDMEMLSFLTAAFSSTDFKTAMQLTFAMCLYQLDYSLYALDLTKSPTPFHDFNDRYLDFLISTSDAARAQREKNNFFKKT